MEMIRILIADDHAVVRRGLRTMISTEPGMEVVDEAADGVEAVQKALSLRPDVILLDLVMPHQGGVDAIRQIKRDDPDAHILVLTSFAEDDKVFPAIKAGALGYLLKSSSPDELIRAIRDVSQGVPSLHPTVARKLVGEFSRPAEHPPEQEAMTEREIDVLKLVAQGLSNREIAERLVISEWTARTHVRNILGKLNLSNRTQAALYALRIGLVVLEQVSPGLD
jgi:NarL family two-component system response regulator LiaR